MWDKPAFFHVVYLASLSTINFGRTAVFGQTYGYQPANPAPVYAYTPAPPSPYVGALCGVYSAVCQSTGGLCTQYCTICANSATTTTTPAPSYADGSRQAASNAYSTSASYYTTPAPSLCPAKNAAEFASVSSTLCTLYGAICTATGTLLCKEYSELQCVAPAPVYSYYGSTAPAPVSLPTALCANYNSLCNLTGTFCKESCALCPQPVVATTPASYSYGNAPSSSKSGYQGPSYYATPAPSPCPTPVTAAAAAASAALCTLYGILCSSYNVLCPQRAILCVTPSTTLAPYVQPTTMSYQYTTPAYVYTTTAPPAYVGALCGVYSSVCQSTGALCTQYCTICANLPTTTTTPAPQYAYGSQTSSNSYGSPPSYYTTPAPSLCPAKNSAQFAAVSSTLCTLYNAICQATGSLLCKEYAELQCVVPAPVYSYYGSTTPAPVSLPTVLCANFNSLCNLTGTFCKESCALCPQPVATTTTTPYSYSYGGSSPSMSSTAYGGSSYYTTTPAPSYCPAPVTAASTAASAALCTLYGILCAQYNVLCPQRAILCGAAATTAAPSYGSQSYGGSSSSVSGGNGLWFGFNAGANQRVYQNPQMYFKPMDTRNQQNDYLF